MKILLRDLWQSSLFRCVFLSDFLIFLHLILPSCIPFLIATRCLLTVQILASHSLAYKCAHSSTAHRINACPLPSGSCMSCQLHLLPFLSTSYIQGLLNCLFCFKIPGCPAWNAPLIPRPALNMIKWILSMKILPQVSCTD